ncbi:hypothetical protein ACFXPW_34085 [Streptomyces goshikiensis]|uniref:hypothetical protein n=1 Tax=Streptomyces goshikiensis TaxID=1942 RepID=UPI0036932FC4
MKRSVRSRALAALTVLAAAGALSAVASPALAAPADGDSHYVFVLGNNNHVQVAEDDVFNAGRDNTVGSNDGTAPPAVATAAARTFGMPATNWTRMF